MGTEKREIKERKGVFVVNGKFYLFSKGTNYAGLMDPMTEEDAKAEPEVPNWARFGYQIPDEPTAQVIADSYKSGQASSSGVKKL